VLEPVHRRVGIGADDRDVAQRGLEVLFGGVQAEEPGVERAEIEPLDVDLDVGLGELALDDLQFAA
jgi:hypothetical protein